MSLKRKNKRCMIYENKVHKNKAQMNEIFINERKNSNSNINKLKTRISKTNIYKIDNIDYENDGDKYLEHEDKMNRSRIHFLMICTKFYICIESFIYMCYLLLELYTDGYDKAILNLKYLSIFLCVLYIIVIIFFNSMKDLSGTIYEREIKIRNYNSLLYLLSALILTFMADYYLLLQHENLFGVLYFVGVQMSYMLYIYSNHSTLSLHLNNRYLFGFVLLGCIIYGSGLIVLQMVGIGITFFEIILILYLSLFIINISFCVFQWIKCKRTKVVYEKEYMVSMSNKYICILFGLVLYFICDLMVGIYNVDMYISEDVLPSVLTSIAEVGMWVFYLPGKVMICLSAYFISKENISS